jgi:hypothetical protein
LSEFSAEGLANLIVYGFISNVVPDFISLIETRYILNFMQQSQSAFAQLIGVIVDLALTLAISLVTAHIILSTVWYDSPFAWKWTPLAILGHPTDSRQNHRWLTIVIPAFLTSIWIWLYAGSGFLLKAARRFVIGFAWLNRHFDIEKKPLQSIGLVAGAIVAVVYWGAVVVMRLV